MSDRPLHAISFDVEEFFQVANLSHRFPAESWDDVAPRLDQGMDPILECLERNDAKATFFFLGWVAERRPDVVQRCLAAGHEIASHGFEHRFLDDIGTPAALDEDLARTEEVLVRAGAPRPIGFRASTFTLTRDTWWAIDVLVRRGYAYDSSIHPVRHPTYGIPDFEPGISTIQSSDGGTIVEFPVATYPFLGRNLPVGGGGYFRLLPGAVHRAAIRKLEQRARPVALYLHPWEFDPAQPRVPAPYLKRFRHYLNLDKSLARLDALLQGFRFGSMQSVLTELGYLSVVE